SKVLDLMPGVGYFTRIFAKAVGDKGYVYAYQPTQFDEFIKKRTGATEITTAFLSKPYEAYKNVSVLHGSIEKVVVPEPLDVVWTSRNYHDMHDAFMGPADLKVVNKAIYDSLKPGGVFVVLDHAAEPGSGLRDTDTLHRIDEAAVKKEVEAAGFKLVGESKLLRNPADDHKAKAFDASVKVKPDSLIIKSGSPMNENGGGGERRTTEWCMRVVPPASLIPAFLSVHAPAQPPPPPQPEAQAAPQAPSGPHRVRGTIVS